MAGIVFSTSDHALVTQAVAAAEAGTDGEIVTIVARRSASYADVPLAYALLAMVAVAAIAGADPALIDWLLVPFAGGWGDAEPRLVPLAIMLLQVIVAVIVMLVMRRPDWRVAMTPKPLRAARVRRRAIELFRVGAERRTQARVGVLLYLSLDEHVAEIVADEAIHARVPPERWGEAMAALVDQVRAGHPAQGMAAAVAAIGSIIGEHFPKTEGDRNELPDRLIEL